MLKERNKASLQFDFSKKKLIAPALILLSCLLILLLNPHLLRETQESGETTLYLGRAVLYGLLMFLACFFCVTKWKLTDRDRRKAGWITLFVIPLLCTVAVEWINASDLLKTFNIAKWFGNYLCYLLLFVICYALLRRILPTVIIATAISLAFGIVTYYTIEFRGLPVLPWDFQSIFTALGVAGGYHYKVTFEMLFSLLLMCACFALTASFRRDVKKDSKRSKRKERLWFVSLAIVLGVALLPMDLLTNIGISVWPWNQKASTRMTGVSAGFFGNLQFVMVDKPENYSAEQVAERYAQFTADAQKAPKEVNSLLPAKDSTASPRPTVIVVMNESFTDLQSIAGDRISLTEDNMPFIHSLMESEDVISGTAYSSVFGGSTCDSEFEFLTGNSMSFLPVGSKPFQQYIKSDQSSLVSTLKALGYKSMAIHPGNEAAWNRDQTYPNLGFDEYLYNTAFHTRRSLQRGMTRDSSCYQEVIEQYEQHKRQSSDPLFVWNVTIQNHGGYAHEDYKSRIQVEGAQGDYPEAEEYLTLIKDSDDDLKVLYNYFKKAEEPVVILFFGDHWPKLEEEFHELVLGVEDLTAATVEESMQQYAVPYFIWANYELSDPGQDFNVTSINYLSSLLLKASGLESTPYNEFLLRLHQTLPVITGVGKMDQKGQYYSQFTKTPYEDLLSDYEMLQFNQLFDKEGRVSAWFELNFGGG